MIATNATGQVTLRTALDWSLNIPAVKVMQFAGIDNVKNAGGTYGNYPVDQQLGAELGARRLNVTPFEMVQAYTVFANYGEFIPLHGIN